MARLPIDHRARARRAWPHLVRAAEHRIPITYGDLCAKLGLHHRSARWFLGVIQEHCRSHGLPALQAVAVNASTLVPGAGYVATPRHGHVYRREVQRVFHRKWRKMPPF